MAKKSLVILIMYAPQIAVDQSLKNRFGEKLEDVLRNLLTTKTFDIEEHLNGHVGTWD